MSLKKRLRNIKIEKGPSNVTRRIYLIFFGNRCAVFSHRFATGTDANF